MRILIVMMIVAGCYDPPVDDCQFTCPDSKCPGDLTCTAGVCRVQGATGSCPCPTPPMGCSIVTTTRDVCLASCSDPRPWPGALAACTNTPPWRLAVLDTSNTLSAGEDALMSPVSWIGLTRGNLVDDWMWVGGSGSISPLSSEWTSDNQHSGKLNMCGALFDGKLYSDGCANANAYACTAN